MAELNVTAPFRREAAQKILLRQLQEGKIVQEESTTVLVLSSLEKATRVNVVATILVKEKTGNITNLLVDDGTGQAVLRFFEPLPALEGAEVGKTMLIIAKPRTYNQEIYLSPEIIKVVSSSWLQVRMKELEVGLKKVSPSAGAELVAFSDAEMVEKKEIMVETVEKAELLPQTKIINLLKTLDSGPGVPVEEILEKSALPETERLLEKLLESGEIFRNAPGRVKVL